MSRQLHGTPIDYEGNVLDRLSSKDRFNFFYSHFIEREKSYVDKAITKSIPHGRVLNVGCGRHGTERILFPEPQYEITGVDVSDDSLRILREERLYNYVYRASIVALPFANETFDIVYLRLILHHLVSPQNILAPGLRECFRVLRRGGILALVEPNSWHPVGALMNVAHLLGADRFIHGTNDDVALSPRMLRNTLAEFSSTLSVYAVTYSWRRLPISLQERIGRFDVVADKVLARAPYFAHTLMTVSRKQIILKQLRVSFSALKQSE